LAVELSVLGVNVAKIYRDKRPGKRMLKNWFSINNNRDIEKT